MKTVLTILFLILFSFNSSFSADMLSLDEINFYCLNDDGTKKNYVRKVGGFDSKNESKITKIEYMPGNEIVWVHYDDSTYLRIENDSGRTILKTGQRFSKECYFEIQTQSQNEKNKNNQNFNDLESIVLTNLDLIKKLEKKIEQLEVRIEELKKLETSVKKLENNKNIEQVMSSVEGHSIRCEYFGGWSGIIIYAQPFTSTDEFFTKHQDGIYSLSGTAIVEGKDLNTQIPISYLASKKGDTWDVVDDGLNERMGSAGDGDTVDQIGELPKTSCLIDTIIAK